METDVVVDLVGGFVGPGTGSASGNFVSVQPSRIVDSRTCLGLSPCGGAPLPAGVWTDVQLSGIADAGDPRSVIPSNAMAVALSVTVDSPALRGFLSVVPGGTTVPSTSSLNFEAGQTATSLVFVSIDGPANGIARFLANRSAHLQVDILGWFTGPPVKVGGGGEREGLFVPMRPTRLIDTRPPTYGTPPVPGQVVAVNTAAAGVPEGSAVIVNDVAVQSGGPGQVQIAATAQPQPPSFRNLTIAVPYQTRAASTITRTAAGGFTLTGTMTSNYTSDIAGYFQGPTPQPLAVDQTVRLTAIPALFDMANLDVSEDGRYVLIDDPHTGNGSVKLWDRTTGVATDILPEVLTSVAHGNFTLTGDGEEVLFSWQNYPVTGVNRQVWSYNIASGQYTIISVDGNGQFGTDGDSATRGVSTDGSVVLMSSNASLSPADTVPGSPNWYIRDRLHNTTTLVPIPAVTSVYPMLSSDGSTVVWGEATGTAGTTALRSYKVATGTTTTLVVPEIFDFSMQISADATTALIQVPRSSSYEFDLYMMNVATGARTKVPMPLDSEAFYAVARLSGDGNSIVATISPQSLYRISTSGVILERIDRGYTGYLPNANTETRWTMSSNGRHVLFSSQATNLVPGPVVSPAVYLHDQNAT